MGRAMGRGVGNRCDNKLFCAQLFFTFSHFKSPAYRQDYSSHIFQLDINRPTSCRFRATDRPNFFIFMMLILVMAANLPLLFVGWEGVGLCSYLLIGFWYEDILKAQAGKKAFIVNRIGDACFLIGMFLVLKTFGTLDFLKLDSQILSSTTVSLTTATIISLLLFGGAAG